MCDCRKQFEERSLAYFPEVENGKAVLRGYMLIPSGFQYLECLVEGTRTTAKGKVVSVKKRINAMGKYCMFCGEPFPERKP